MKKTIAIFFLSAFLAVNIAPVSAMTLGGEKNKTEKKDKSKDKKDTKDASSCQKMAEGENAPSCCKKAEPAETAPKKDVK